MGLIKGTGLLLALILTVRSRDIPEDQSAKNPDYAQQVGQSTDGDLAARRIWTGGDVADDDDGKSVQGVIPRGDLRGGGWSGLVSIARGSYGEDGADEWDASPSESEARGVLYTGERTRWMPSKSRYGTKKDAAREESAEIPLQEHQRRQRIQLQQQLLKRVPEGRRSLMQLENLGGGILMDDDEDDEEVEEAEVEEEEEDAVEDVTAKRVRSRVPPPPQPFSKLPSLRPPTGANEPTPGKPPALGDLKSILKMTGPLSLSEVLQRKNLSLEELLRGSRLALSAVAQSATTEGAVETEHRRRRPVPTGSRPQLKRRRPTPPPEFLPDPPTSPTPVYIPTTQTTTTERTTTTTSTTTSTTTEEPRTTTEEPEAVTVRQSPRAQWFTSSGDPSRDILEIILQEDENDGPSLAEILSSRNMTVADLIEQRERASGRSTITSLFPASSTTDKEWEGSRGNEEGQKEIGEGRTNSAGEEDEGRKGRGFAQFHLMESDWEDPLVARTESTTQENVEVEDDQQVTQTRNAYQVISSQDAVVQLPKPSEAKIIHGPKPSATIFVSPPKPTETKIVNHPKIIEKTSQHIHVLPTHEDPRHTFPGDGNRPLIRTRVTVPTTSTEEISTSEQQVHGDSMIQNSRRATIDEHVHEKSQKRSGLPEGVKSAIIASSSLLGIALLIFLSIFAVFRYRQWQRRRGMGPYLCVAVLEAAAGRKKNKGPKIIKQEKAKEKGWGDTFDSAQERLWRTLRRGRCRFYDHESGQM